MQQDVQRIYRIHSAALWKSMEETSIIDVEVFEHS